MLSKQSYRSADEPCFLMMPMVQAVSCVKAEVCRAWMAVSVSDTHAQLQAVEQYRSAYYICLLCLPTIFACYVCLLCLPTCLQDDVLRGGVIMAAFLHIASIPGSSRGLVEWGYGPECQVHLVLVETCHFCEVVHVGIIILRRQIVQVAIRVPTAGQQGN